MMKEYEIIYSITGNASAIVRANSLEEAEKMAEDMEIESSSLIEWSFDEVKDVKELE